MRHSSASRGGDRGASGHRVAAALNCPSHDQLVFAEVWREQKHIDFLGAATPYRCCPRHWGVTCAAARFSEVHTSSHSTSIKGPRRCIRCSCEAQTATPDARHTSPGAAWYVVSRGYQRQCRSRCNRQPQFGPALRTRPKPEGTLAGLRQRRWSQQLTPTRSFLQSCSLTRIPPGQSFQFGTEKPKRETKLDQGWIFPQMVEIWHHFQADLPEAPLLGLSGVWVRA